MRIAKIGKKAGLISGSFHFYLDCFKCREFVNYVDNDKNEWFRTMKKYYPEIQSWAHTMMYSPSRRLITWEDDVTGELCGFCILKLTHDVYDLKPKIKLCSIYVNKKYRGFGLSTKTINAVKKFLISLNFSKMYTTAFKYDTKCRQTSSSKFLEHVGFKPVGEKIETGEVIYEMSWKDCL